MEVSALLRGADACRATCRGSQQSRRSQLNREIHRDMRLRAGAENLLRATSNRAVRETAALELSFVNSHLKLLREQLSALNSNLEIYQGQGHDSTLPMIPLGLKETRDIDFRESFKDFILEHYSEDGGRFDGAIRSFMEVRQAMRRPARSKSGVQLLMRYLGVLYYVERRFFPADRNIGIYFEWYDALTGVSSVQRTVAFEKASVLFNLAALYTQIGSKQDRHMNLEAADEAIDNFLRAAGTLRYIGDHFTHPPSFDLSTPTLDALTALLLAQARECHFEKQQTMVDRIDITRMLEHGVHDGEEQIKLVELAQEAQLISDEYTRVLLLFSHEELKEFIPAAWTALVQVKMELYKCVAHHYISTLLMNANSISEETLETFRYLYTELDDPTTTDVRMPSTKENTQTLGFCHLRQSMSSLEDASRHARLNRELRSKAGLQATLSSMKDRIYATCEKKKIQNPEELDHYLDPPQLIAATKFQMEISSPDLTTQIEDPFRDLGPLSFFSAKRQWTQPRTVTLRRRGGGFGLSVKGSAPVVIASVEEDGSPAEVGGVRAGDAIVGIFGDDARWLTHEDIVAIVRTAGDTLTLRLVTPLDPKVHQKGRLSPHSTSSSASLGTNSYTTPRSSSGSSSGGSMGRHKHRKGEASPEPASNGTMKKLTRSLFRRSKSSEQEADIRIYKSNASIR